MAPRSDDEPLMYGDIPDLTDKIIGRFAKTFLWSCVGLVFSGLAGLYMFLKGINESKFNQQVQGKDLEIIKTNQQATANENKALREALIRQEEQIKNLVQQIENLKR